VAAGGRKAGKTRQHTMQAHEVSVPAPCSTQAHSHTAPLPHHMQHHQPSTSALGHAKQQMESTSGHGAGRRSSSAQRTCSDLVVLTQSLMGKDMNSLYCLMRDCRYGYRGGGTDGAVHRWWVHMGRYTGGSTDAHASQRSILLSAFCGTTHTNSEQAVLLSTPAGNPKYRSTKQTCIHRAHNTATPLLPSTQYPAPTSSLAGSENSVASGFRCSVMRVPRGMSAAASSLTAV
jgi:hypothetical protein